MLTCEVCWRNKKNVKIYKEKLTCSRCMEKEIRYSKGKHDYCGMVDVICDPHNPFVEELNKSD